MEKYREYTLIKDLPYFPIHNKYSDQSSDKLSSHGNLRKKQTTDVYLPSQLCSSDLDSPSETKPPLVVFVHGGGWRRGDKDGWRHFLSDDINLLVAFIHWIQGLYGNVGAAFARRGIPCAVMSYPLAKLKSPWILLELFTSYLCSLLFLCVMSGAIFITVSILALLTSKRLYNTISPLTQFQRLSCSNAKPVLVFHMVLTNIVILGVILFQHRHYKLTPISITCIGLVSVIGFTTCNCFLPTQSLMNFCVVTLFTSQGILLMSNLLSRQASPADQVNSLQLCISYLQRLGRENGWFDPTSIFLMGHSAGGHLCSLASLEIGKRPRYGVQASHIKGVLAVSAVLHVENLNFDPVKRLYLHPSFGKNPDNWTTVCPLTNLKSRNAGHQVPHFIVISAQRDFHLIKDAKAFSEHLSDLHDIDAEHIILPRTNHTSIICNIDSSPSLKSPSLLDVCLQYINKRL